MCLLWSLFIYLKRFEKKIFALLSLEMAMLLLISLFFLYKGSLFSYGLSSLGFLFLIFMVLDSVLGISLLIFSSRLSNSVSMKFF